MAAKPRGTITPAPNFNPERVAIKLQKAMKGMGTNEKVVIDMLTTHTNEQRQLIRKKYRSMYARDLLEDMKAELGGHFEHVCIALLTPQDEFLVQSLNKAIKGEFPDNFSVIDIILAWRAQEIETFKNLYKESEFLLNIGNLYPNCTACARNNLSSAMGDAILNRQLADDRIERLSNKFSIDLDGEFPCDMNEDLTAFLKSWLNSSRDQETGDDNEDKVEEDINALKLAVSEKSRDYLVTILTTRSRNHLKRVADRLFKEIDVENTLMDAFEAAVAVAYVALLKIIHDTPRYFAERLQTVIKGNETHDDTLIRIMVTRSEIDLADIKDRYKELYGKDLTEIVAEDTSGDYRKMIIKLLG